MEREEGRPPRLGTVEMPAGKRPDAGDHWADLGGLQPPRG
jgi:hypothetical protein